MTADATTATGTALPPGVVEIRRSTPKLLAAIIRNPLTSLPQECYEERLVLTHTLGQSRAYVCDPALIHEAIVRNADSLSKSDELKRVLGPALGNGLLTADGATWRWQRQALAPAFQHDRLSALPPAMIAAAEATRDAWLALPRRSVVDLGPAMMRTTFAIILETMLSGPEGMDAGRVERGVTDYLDATSWMFALSLLKAPRWTPFPGRRRALSANRFMRTTVRTRVETRRRAATQSNDLIGMLLAAVDPETGRALTDEDITDNILTFISAGHETTAAALGWTFALLADHPDCVQRLVDEIDAVTGGDPVQPRHIAELVYARQIVNEAMRLYPPAPLIARAVLRDLDIGGVTLKAGATIFVPIYAIHRHKTLWANPDVFDPDRFAPEVTRPRFAFLPFGAGPRVCIGTAFAMTEAVAILAVLAKAVRLERVEPTLPEPMMRVTLRPARPIRMRIAAR